MADDGFTVRIDDDLAGDVKAAAASWGVTVEAYVHDVLVSCVADWSESLDRLAKYDSTGESIDATDAMAGFCEAVASRFTR